MFTTGAGKPISNPLSELEQTIVDKLSLSSKLYPTLQENIKAAAFLHSFKNLLALEHLALEQRMVARFQHKTYLNSSIRKLKASDIPSGCHLVLAVFAVAKESLVFTDFFEFLTVKSVRKLKLAPGDFVRLQGARLEMGELIANPNGIMKVRLDIPMRVTFFGVQSTLPPVPRLSYFVTGDVPYVRLVVFRGLSGFWTAFMGSERHILAEEDREEFTEVCGAGITRLEWSHRAIVTDPWGTRFTTISLPTVGSEEDGGGALRPGEALDILNCRCVVSARDGKLNFFTSRSSRVGRCAIKYFLTCWPPPSLCCDLAVESVVEISEGVFQLDGVYELRLDFKPGLFNARRRLNRARAKLQTAEKKVLKNLRKCGSRVYFADVLDIDISKSS